MSVRTNLLSLTFSLLLFFLEAVEEPIAAKFHNKVNNRIKKMWVKYVNEEGKVLALTSTPNASPG